ncbi:MAG: tetratricopeptide repeat protein [Chitinophagales bacterium]|nr:tetratricopeptide repeat protein [Chitinophagales bacterium]
MNNKSGNNPTFAGVNLPGNRYTIFPWLRQLLLWGSCCCLLPLNAQNTADSLAKLLQTAPHDTHRITLLTDYAWEIAETETNVAEIRLQEALELARQLGYTKGEANAWNGMGILEEIRENDSLALEYYQKALDLRRQLGDQSGIGRSLTNLGNLYESTGKLTKAIQYYRESLSVFESLKDTLRMARAYTNISGVLSTGGSYPEAFSELNKARLLMENRGDLATLFKIYTQIGHNRFDQDQFSKAREWYEKSLRLREKLGDPFDIADGYNDLGNALDEMDNQDTSRLAVDYYLKALSIFRELDDQSAVGNVCNNLGDAYKHLEQFDEALKYLRESEKIRLELEDEPGLMETYNTLNDVLFRQGKLRESLRYLQKCESIASEIGNSNVLMGAYKDYVRYYEATKDYRKAFEYQTRYNDLRYKLIDEQRSQNIETQQALTREQEKQLALDRERQTTALREAELANARTFRNALLGGAVLLVLLVGLLYSRNRLRARANRLLTAKNEAIEREKQRADNLLKNILPEKTAEELKTEGVVKPVHYASVTVLFSDFKNFTRIAESMSPEALVKELDEYFRTFDAIMERHKLEKIKTIGDAYMCAGGLPEPNETHAMDTVKAALEMQQAIRDMAARKIAQGKPYFEMRIGIHTGPVVAGVVGSHKFAYDIWGDTVNTAARMEQSSEPGRINLSQTTWEEVKDKVPCTFRGKLPAKNKGEIAMYFVEDHLNGFPKS